MYNNEKESELMRLNYGGDRINNFNKYSNGEFCQDNGGKLVIDEFSNSFCYLDIKCSTRTQGSFNVLYFKQVRCANELLEEKQTKSQRYSKTLQNYNYNN
ncbi:hypothetical protein Trydic_g8511 [Trypoxylus dichotomus]